MTRTRSRKYPEPTTASGMDSDESEVDVGKLEGRRAASAPSDAARDGPAGAGGVRYSSGRHPSMALRCIAGDAGRARCDSD